MLFTRLRLSGFKSFVDPTDLVIEPGMTGIVGPNGCGKSNLVEALRWVMGETSAKKMRGDDMDDVIFGGTSHRPQRNLAEVALVIDNRGRTAPAGLNEADELEVSRRIERGSGSDYRVNGKLVRARDVQLLFADNASGANSPALVSQGKVGQIINAKPQDRRMLLEEAAGITGLHSRRHEAELRLRAAENNLTRLDDVIGAMDTQLQSLRKQARQASRYRNLSEQIRRAEAVLWHLRWIACEAEQERSRTAFAAAEGMVRELMLAVSRLTAKRGEDAAGLPDRRRDEQAAAATLQRLTIARDQLDGEERRVAEQQAALRRRLQQIAGDLGREEALAADAGDALGRLDAERERLAAAQSDEEMLEEAAREALADAREGVDDLDRQLTRLTEQVAADEARRGSAQRQMAELEGRAATLARRLSEQQAQRAALEAEIAGRADIAESEMAVEVAEQRLEDAREAAEAAERARHDAEPAQARARDAMQAADAARTRLKAEEKALRDLLAVDGGDLFPPLVDAVTVASGYEVALAAALRDDLTAPLNEAAPVHWRGLPPLPAVAPLPEGAEPLPWFVQGPEAAARALAHVGVVADAGVGAALAASLAPGQTLVSRDGGAWRWDGLTVAAGAPTAAAVRLKQRNRLRELDIEIEAADEKVEQARSALDAARRGVEEAVARDRQARDAVRIAVDAVGSARDRHARLAKEAAAAQSRLAALTEAVERLTADRQDADAQLAAAREALGALPDAREGRERVNELRAALAERRTVLAEKQNALDRLTREAQARRQRLAAIEQEKASWGTRSQGAGGRVAELKERAAAAEAELSALEDRPARISADRQELLGRIADADRARRRAADALAAEEAKLAGTETELRQAEAGLADAREARARAEAAVGAAVQQAATLTERIAERLDCRPEDTRAAAELGPDDELPEAAAVEARLEKLVRERENMGPVNLRAEIEAAELEAQITSLQTERQDLVDAIARLRHGIASLNREARERLVAAFEVVNRHFQELFTRLFGGGKAHLELVNADDPLEAGLEIYASPPGKKLQVLSLLSGGEQALTALSLLFAVFRSNPAPICVLDEVDAPLDEANVGRFCDLVEDIAREGNTRFLIITHHRLTMARVDRLFGVTMAERGVSQLVSVDLSRAVELRGAAVA
ncbi:AAA family ATPase [Azospirillum sp. RWY-5-1]|uniref:Chromosome partition protein Smc n=1 Tax=Azospirillum oleiclasticum TaxID=2735135 RepID=A0ABX2T297_9PROT|nr:AAA family ATPase [Azospirillum oleiclasticum]NYZ11030.1 AAA family ATPase [Azospirillum oleiclasticum]NYZ18192.1 AAA family ATPase [Azospirillum oleiclasticum]